MDDLLQKMNVKTFNLTPDDLRVLISQYIKVSTTKQENRIKIDCE